MNDNDFDDLIRKNLENIDGPEATSEALQDFHIRMESFHQAPWYSKYRGAVMAASILALFTFINGAMYHYRFTPAPVQIIETGKINYQRKIDSLIIYTNLLRNEVTSSLKIISQLNENETQNLKIIARYNNERTDLNSNGNRLYLGGVASLPVNILKKLQHQNNLEINGGKVWLIVNDSTRTKRIHYDVEYVMSPGDVRYGDTTVINTVTLKNPTIAKLKADLPPSIINKLEENSYKGGIGFSLSPHVDFVQSSFSKGDGSISPRVGVRADWIFSPHLSIQTSLDYLCNTVTLSDDFQNYHLPNLTTAPTSLGTLQRISISNYLVGVPIAARYKWWISSDYQLQVSAGVTPFFSFHKQYKYFYPFPGNVGNPDDNLVTVSEFSKTGYNSSTTTISFGIIKNLKKNRSLELSAFYEQGILTSSSQPYKFNLVGLRSAFNFPIR